MTMPNWLLRAFATVLLAVFALPSCITRGLWTAPTPYPDPSGGGACRVAIGPSLDDAFLYVHVDPKDPKAQRWAAYLSPRTSWLRVRVTEHVASFRRIVEAARLEQLARRRAPADAEPPRFWSNGPFALSIVRTADGERVEVRICVGATERGRRLPFAEDLDGLAQRDRYFGTRFGPYEFRAACTCDAVIGPPSVSLPWPTDSARLAVFESRRESTTAEKIVLTPPCLLLDAVLSPFELLALSDWW